MTIACGLTGADLRRNILIHYDTVRQDQTKAQKPLHGSRKLCVSHETRFRDLGCVFSCEHGVIWLSTGSLVKRHQATSFRLDFICFIQRPRELNKLIVNKCEGKLSKLYTESCGISCFFPLATYSKPETVYSNETEADAIT